MVDLVYPSAPRCDASGCNNLRTYVSKCNMKTCPDGRKYRQACDNHIQLLCGPELVW